MHVFCTTFQDHLCLLQLGLTVKIAQLGHVAIGNFFQKFQVTAIRLYLMTT